MDYTGITFGLDVLISVIFGAGGALAVWFKMKGKQDIQSVEIAGLKSDLEDLKEEKKESHNQIYNRIDSLKVVVEKNRENSDNGINAMTANMNAMELRIIKAIHDIKN
jgi:hypothetical protein